MAVFNADKVPDDKLSMKFDMNTIQHLGISMYTKLPPVIGEIVANTYDADASNVIIKMNDNNNEEKTITITDNGIGMDFNEINYKFLVIGRNRRLAEDLTPTRNRKAIGRKGIGKLSVFGIAKDINITSIKNGIKNKFVMNLDDIEKCEGNIYHPDHPIRNVKAIEGNGTIVELKNLMRKSKFKPNEIAEDLAKRFLIFDENFQVKIIYNDNEKKPIIVSNRLRFKKIRKEFIWNFPNSQIKSAYQFKDQVIGEIFTAPKPIPASLKGVYLVARGKLVHSNSFYGIRADDYVHSYISGFLNVDFIDDDPNIDLISTNRESLNWENESTSKLQNYLQNVLKFVSRDWRKRIKEVKEDYIEEKKGINVNDWVSSLPIQERTVARKITNAILNDTNLELDKSADLIGYVRDSFEYESFKEFAYKLEAVEDITASEILKLFKDWEVIEAKELYKLAIVRIETIKKFEKNIKENVREKPEFHDFLRTFPWLLDPRIMKLEDEVTYSDLLREKFKEPESVLVKNRRIDFLCIDLANTIFIIELKRPGVKANSKNLDQALEYASFLKKHKGNDPEFSKRSISTFIICAGIAHSDMAEEKAESYEKTGKVYVRTYIELLAQARKYHKDFIDKYDQIESKRE